MLVVKPARTVRLAAVTIREYFKGRSDRMRKALGTGGLVAAASVALFATTGNSSAVVGYVAAGLGILGAAVMLGALLYLDRTRCPTCRERLGIQFANQNSLGRRISFCPFCGVGFDKCQVQNP